MKTSNDLFKQRLLMHSNYILGRIGVVEFLY